MEFSALTAISPIDGRYRNKTETLGAYFSEYALIKYRVYVEIEYFIALYQLGLPQLESFDKNKIDALRDLYIQFSVNDANKVKEIEKTINHDVKAVEYFIKEKMKEMGIGAEYEFVHFGLTSQDINNTSIPLSIKEFFIEEYFSLFNGMVETLKNLSVHCENTPILARTHGQPASPTMLSKEINVFIERLEVQLSQLTKIPYSAKFGGATGNFNAHNIAYPEIDWVDFANNFVNKSLGLNRSQTTTQIEHYDNLSALFDACKRINIILIDFCRDVWTYISMNYFKQKINPNEVGSSAMPHKVNPIDFENAEGNLGLANAGFEFFSRKLPISRLQRDLTDSTVLRNIGNYFAHTVIAFQSIIKGVNKLEINKAVIENELNENWMVVAEAIQTILRREGVPNPYEKLKALTRTTSEINPKIIKHFIDNLEVSDEVKEELKRITPHNYVGVFK